MRVWLCVRPAEPHVTVAVHANVRVGTLAVILADVAAHLRIDGRAVVAERFGADSVRHPRVAAPAVAPVEVKKCTSGPRTENYGEQSPA